MKLHTPYIALTVAAYAAFTILFDTFPRSVVSELEKRELATFPEFSVERLFDGTFTNAVSSWFSDSEPFRDQFMALSMQFDNWTRITTSEENVTFHASTDVMADTEGEGPSGENMEDVPEEPLQVGEYENHVTADENAKIANAGIIIVGAPPAARALMAYGGSATGCTGYAEAANAYYDEFAPNVNIYCMVIPTSAEFYCPDKVRKATRPQRPTIQNVYNHLKPGVKPVDIYTALGEHADEDIYLRTDHHWAPLGAFYAAREFARVAGVPYRELSSYEQRVVHGYVGSMYGYSHDISVKQSPEDFVFYVPKEVEYTTTYIDYTVNRDFRITRESKPHKGIFFHKFHDGSGAAYCTFMGSDMRITTVRTSTKNGRRVLILKDSFGNALPGYLFYSFEEVHVVDSRYFSKNMRQYVADNHITDILFANNIFKAYSSHTYRNYMRFLSQDGSLQPAKATSAPSAVANSASSAEGLSKPQVSSTICKDSATSGSSPSTPTTPSGTVNRTSNVSSRDSIN